MFELVDGFCLIGLMICCDLLEYIVWDVIGFDMLFVVLVIG